VRGDPFGEDIVRLGYDAQGVLRRKLVGVNAGALANEDTDEREVICLARRDLLADAYQPEQLLSLDPYLLLDRV
jgi:hypothetical protein